MTAPRRPSPVFGSASTLRGGTGWVPPAVEEVARLLPDYQVLALLGCGSMGAVYLALQPALDRPVAIKLLPLEMSAEEEFAQRFVCEARALARLNHPCITPVYDSGRTAEGHLYYVMEFVDGASLPGRIAAGLQPEEALGIALQVCEALACAHAAGIVHRDIKPANVLLDQQGRVKVADFGIAHMAEGSGSLTLTQTGRCLGTPDYIAPEQCRGAAVDQRADLFSTGVMLYEMLCGEVPRGVFTPPSRRTKCTARVDRIVAKAMRQAPEQRFQSAVEMQAALAAAQRRPLKRGPRLVRVLAVGAMLAAAASALYFLPAGSATSPAAPAAARSPVPSLPETAQWLFRVGNDFSYLTLERPGVEPVKVTSLAALPPGDWQVVELWLDRFQCLPAAQPVLRQDFQRHTAGLTRLRSLFCRIIEVPDADLAFLRNNPALTELSLEGLPLTDAVLEHIKDLKNLRRLNISADLAQGSPFTGRGLGELACRAVLTDLVVIGTRFDDAAACGLLAFPNLRTAALSSTAITDACLPTLCMHPGLESLEIDHTAVTDAGVAALAAMKPLRWLAVSGIQESTLTMLRTALPRCKVGSKQ
ncbi:MAG: protein kinase [Verrucomicrobiales bacterium]|nr:protein kinase [Verrucomicrobiales bacterium]